MQWKHFALHLACAVLGAFAAMMHSTSTASARPHVSELAGRVIAEYREMPGLALSPPQACRLWGLDAQTCQALLAHMVEQRVLRRTVRGVFVLC